MNIAANPNDPTAALWASLRDFIVQAFTLFGDPCAIAARAFTLRQTHAPLMHYLRQCETLLRKLLFIDALELLPSIPPPARGKRRSQHARGGPRRFHTQDPENSETWRVTFRVCASPMDRRRPRRPAPAPDQTMPAGRRRSISSAARFVSTWPAAERFEALLRAFNDPAPYVKRLARLIKRKTQLARAYLHVPERRYGQSVLEEPIRDAARLARARWRNPDSS